MFTPEGELREEFKHLENEASAAPDDAQQVGAEPVAELHAPTAVEPEERRGPILDPDPDPGPGPVSSPPSGAPSGVGFQDLVGLLAEHTALYLGEGALPDGKTIQDLRAAQLHIDLLDVLRRKTAGNLAAEEAALLEDVLYRLRLVYVEKKRQEQS